jgi:hypothetical protein
MNEIHELGLMYLNYEILNADTNNLFGRESVPTDNLKDVKILCIIYVLLFNRGTSKSEVTKYVEEFTEKTHLEDE